MEAMLIINSCGGRDQRGITEVGSRRGVYSDLRVIFGSESSLGDKLGT